MAAACLYGAAGASAASPEPKPGAQPGPSLEIWSGGEAFGEIWSAYGGASWAPFGGVHEDGLRLRAVLGYGDYHSGTVAFGDLLVGYHKQLGPVTIKVLAGITVADHHPVDPASALEGSDIGARGVLELWWAVTDRAWASADLSWGSLQMDHGSRLRVGWRILPELSAGIEGGSAGTWERDIGRVGGFLRYEWAGGEVAVAAGAAFAGAPGAWEGEASPFATVSILTRF